MNRRQASAQVGRRRPAGDEAEVRRPHSGHGRRAVDAWRIDDGEVVARLSQRRESLVEGCGVDPLELRPLIGLPGVGPIGQRPLAVEFEHEHAPALLGRGDGDRGRGRAFPRAAFLGDKRDHMHKDTIAMVSLCHGVAAYC